VNGVVVVVMAVSPTSFKQRTELLVEHLRFGGKLGAKISSFLTYQTMHDITPTIHISFLA
jgi:hypothetical protein